MAYLMRKERYALLAEETHCLERERKLYRQGRMELGDRLSPPLLRHFLPLGGRETLTLLTKSGLRW